MSEKMKLGEICNFINGRAFKPSEWDKKGLPIVRIQNLNDENAEFNFCSKDIEDKYIIEDNQLLFSWSGTPGTSFGAFFWNRGKAVLNQHIFKVIPKININIEFLRYLLNGNLDTIISKSHGGVGLQHITKRELEEIIVDIPDDKKQEYVAKTLNGITKIINSRKEQLKQFDEIIKSQFVEMFESGKYPKIKLGEEFDVSSGGTPSKNKQEYWNSNDISWIGSNMCQNKIIYKNDGKYISYLGLENSSAKIYPIDTILIALVGATIGKTALLKFETATNQNIAGIQVSERFNAEYVYFAIQNLYYKFTELGKGAFKMANLSFIRNLEISMPPIELQNQFAEIVKVIDKQKFESVIKAEKEIEKIQKNIYYKWGR